MKLTSLIPAHPSYYGNLYTQEQIDAVIADYDASLNFVISKGHTDSTVPRYFQLVRVPGQTIWVIFDSKDGLAEKDYSDEGKRKVIDCTLDAETRDLNDMIKRITELLKQAADGEREAARN